ncbi:hypothetical protein M378DRAFT_168318 [Amanita muscaria Koide BX008]|uniref:Cytochrome b561 domain-containing protein n=1 Tax=Amanita muscaria (strain Koide BX008) TaxID=946122 RepID=A0A0C2WU51_AMAMK|nr:hypothetical protein M378DRAFT_168318 [Amanita muscaria Koide BX008]
MDVDQLPLTPLEVQARNHGLLCAIGFLIILPLGTLFARYARTFTNKWLYVHWSIQFFIAGPIILTGWYFGYQLAENLGATPHFQQSPHQQIGLALLILYLVQVFLGPFIHWFKFHSLFHGHRPPLSYLHVILGLSILALASYQVHYGLYFEWIDFVGVQPIPTWTLNTWLALTIIFWALYGIGWALLPRQFRLEKEFRQKLNSND